MPKLNRRDPRNRALGASARRAARFYDGSPGRELVNCPDCHRPADAMFGDHGGDCIDVVHIAAPGSAVGIVRAFALRYERFSANDLRSAFDRAGVKGTRRGPAFAKAVIEKWIEPDGSIRSTDRATKRHPVQTYRSLIHPEAVKRAAAAAHRSSQPKETNR